MTEQTPIQGQSRSKMLIEKWAPVLDHPDLPEIKDPYKKAMTAIIIENQVNAMQEDHRAMSGSNFLTEYTGPAPNNIGMGQISTFDPILISLVRRALPNLMAYDVAGVQPMTGPTGLIFAMRSRYTSQTGVEAFFNEANTEFTGWASNQTSPLSGQGFGPPNAADVGNNPVLNLANNVGFSTGVGMPTIYAEALGDGSGSNSFAEMAFSIEKVTVSAKSRALKAEYTMELAQDLKAIHGLDAETELSNILSTEVLAEINREVIRTIYYIAKPGAQYGTNVAGVFNLDTDSNGRWSVERFKGLIFHLEREANGIAKETRRGRGNIMIVSSDVASAMVAAKMLDYTPELNVSLTIDDTGNTYAGMLNGRTKVYIDPYFGGMSTGFELVTIGYKGSNPYDAGLFYCPYVPLQMVRAIDTNTFQPKIGFKTRYGMVCNPYAEGLTAGLGALTARSNVYYRILAVQNLM